MTNQFHSSNSFAHLVTFGWQITEDVRTRRLARPQRIITQPEYSEWEIGFGRIGAECRVLARRFGWDAEKVAKTVEDAKCLIIGLFRQGPDDPHKDDSGAWFVYWALNRFTGAPYAASRPRI